MTLPTLHLPAIPHVRHWMTHDAFQSKCSKFPRMMTPLGYHVKYYGIGNDGDVIGASENVEILTPDEQVALLGHDFGNPQQFHGDDAHTGNAIYTTFNRRLREVWRDMVQPGDITLFPFGRGHAAALSDDHQGVTLESGIGYPECFLPFRVYESSQWRAFHQGKEQRNGHFYEWVIPNYFPSDEWTLRTGQGGYSLYFGRLCDIKGVNIVAEIAKRRPDHHFIVCGQGDPTPYLVSPNIEYRSPVLGRARNTLLGDARCVLCPSLFTEPFCGVAVEAMMTGTPVISSPFGAFETTIEHDGTGYRCHTLGDFLAAFDRIHTLDRTYISQRAHSRYSLEAVAPLYDKVFHQLADLYQDGWYSPRSHWVPSGR